MSKFNPDVPETQPSSYLGLSQPVTRLKDFSTPSGPDVNMSGDGTGSSLQSLGNLFSGVVQAGDSLVKKTIEDELYKKIDDKREGYTADLEKAGNIPQVQQVADSSGNAPTSPGTPLNVLPDRADGPLPPELARLPDTLGNLQSASGKLSPTYYTGRLDLIAKDLRTRFPGYRDYIDKQVENITGENPANAYVKQLLTQINQNSAANKSEQEKMIAYVHANDGLPGASIKMQQVVSGKSSWPDLVGWAGSIKAPLERLKAAHANFEANKDNLEAQKIIAGDALNDYGQSKFSNFWNTTASGAGLTPAQITENAQKLQRGETIPGMGDNPNETAIRWSQALDSAESAARQDLIQKANTRPLGPDGKPIPGSRTMAQALGPEELNKRIDSILAPYKDTRSLLTGKAIPLAAATAEMNTALVDSATKRLFSDKDLGAVAKTYSVLNKNAGPNAAQTLIGTAYAGGLPAAIKKRLDYETALLVDPTANTTLKGEVAGSASVGIGTADPSNPTAPVPKEHKDYYNELFAKNRFIGDKNIPIANQQEIAKKFYGPGNEGLISSFKKDATDPVTGQYLEGSVDVFRRLYGNPSVLKGMKELGNQDGQSWDMFKNSADKAFVNEVFSREIKDLTQLPESNAYPFKIIFHDSNGTSSPYFEAIPVKNTPTGSLKQAPTGILNVAQDRYTADVQASIARLNKGFDVMSRIVSEDGKDPNAYVLGTMVRLGLDPKKVQGIPADLANAVIASRPKDPFENKSSNKSQDRIP